MATTGISARAVGDGSVEVTVQAGEPLQRLVRYAVAEHLSGIEYLAGIPGTVGAAPVQNTRLRPADRRHPDRAGWLLQQCGHHPGQRLAPGVYCSTRRTLTLVARDGATATAFATALRTLASQVMRQTGIRLRPEPVMVGYHM
ncbi:hypothetical protein Misp02_00250 [Microtetraspora sp. NBRC 16547]|nr:hypothetical protein Misp02_00250 [Microtetraspora sp. NBRC 16547]